MKRLVKALYEGSVQEKLVESVKRGKKSEVLDLLDAGADINSMTGDGRTMLMLASIYGHLDIVEELLSRRANVNAQDSYGRTALMESISGGYEKIAVALLQKESNVNLQDKDGKTAYDFAKIKNDVNLINLIEKNGGKKAEVNDDDSDAEHIKYFASNKIKTRLAQLIK